MTGVVHALLALAVLAVYEPVRGFPFVAYDDAAFVSENPVVMDGVSRSGVGRALTESPQGNYVPLTWLSHMLDVELFGLDAGAHHVVNLLLHLLSTLLLFEVLRRATGALWPSAFVAAVFGIHPTHVESVAWVAERRDVLSGFFFVLCLGAYTAWTRRGGALRYAALLLAFTLGLLAKPMLVTLPAVLLLLDGWPLRRLELGASRLVAEKLPLLVPAALVSALALGTQDLAMPTLAELPLGARVSNALLGYAGYLGKTLWPANLAVFYPLRLHAEPGPALLAALLLVAISVGVALAWRERPWLAVGWLWFLGTLLPVIGLVQVGSQAMADRYLYLPGIGLSIAVAWEGAARVAGRDAAGRLLAGVAVGWLVVCGLLARAQVATWQDSATLCEHAKSVTGSNVVIERLLGEAYMQAGEDDRALAHYERALHWQPGARRAYGPMGAILARRGQREEALRHLLRAVQVDPGDPQPRVELATLLFRAGQVKPALRELEQALDLEPYSAEVRYRLGEANAVLGRHAFAVNWFAEALTARPPAEDAPIARSNPAVLVALAEGCARAGRYDAAAGWASRALTLLRLAGDTAGAERVERELEHYRRVEATR